MLENSRKNPMVNNVGLAMFVVLVAVVSGVMVLSFTNAFFTFPALTMAFWGSIGLLTAVVSLIVLLWLLI